MPPLGQYFSPMCEADESLPAPKRTWIMDPTDFPLHNRMF
jgi:hypothetical protein